MPGDQLQANYVPVFSPNPLVAQAAVAGNGVLFIDAAGQPAVSYLESSRAYVRVTSTAGNYDPSVANQVTVQIVAQLSTDSEELVLTETGPNTGIFEGSIPLRLSYGSAYPNNGFLETIEVGHPEYQPPHEFDTLRATFSDPTGTSVARIGLTGSRTWFADVNGEEVLSYAAGSTAYVRVEDQNGNTPGQVDRVFIELRSSSGDLEYLELFETSPDSGIFAGSMQLARDTPQTTNGQLYALPGEQITVIHQDAYGATESSAVADIVAAQINFINLRGQEVAAYAQGSTLGLRVIDPGRNFNPGQADSFQDNVRSLVTNDAEVVTLTETGPDTGIFEGTVPSAPAGSPGADGVLVAPPGQVEAEHMSTPNPLLRQATILSTPVPAAFDDTATTLEDTPVVVPVLANDAGAGALAVAAAAQPAHGSVAVNADETITYTPATGYSGPDTFTYLLVDDQGGEAVGHVSVTVTPANRSPVANPDTATTLEDQAVTISVLSNDTDPNNDTLDVTAVTHGANGTAVLNADDTVTYTPNANFSGPDSFTYGISDGNGGMAIGVVTITVTADNDGPAANADSATVAEDGSVSVTVLSNDTDPENDTLDVTDVTQGTNGAVVLNANDTVTYTPNANFSGTDSFTYTISDGNGGTASATVTITITAVNDAPVANADSASVSENGSASIAVLSNDTDVENDTLSVTSVTQGAHGAVVINANNTVTYTPAAGYVGADTFTYTISDGNGGTATASVSVNVDNVNDAPVANADAATLAEDASTTITVLANDSDPDNDVLSVASVTQGAHGTVTINPNKTVTYTPVANYNGGDSFTYTAADGNGGTATATVTVTITAVNDAPVAVNDTASTTAETLVSISVLNNDVDLDGPSLSIASVTQPAHGTVTVNANQTINYTPASAYVGADSFTYTVSDGAGGTATATVNLTVTAPVRVATNLQVLYELEEGSGTTVTDTSGVGTPLNLTIGSASAVSWITGGLSINSATLIQSAGAATKVISACQSTNAITIEAWVEPTSTSQTGPIATVSQQSNKQDFSLSQSGNRWNGTLRTTNTNQAGTSLSSATGTATLNLAHVVYTRDASGNVRIYVNGVQSASSTLAGNFSSWTSTYKLGLANELSSGSPWRGRLYLVAIYNRALSSTEVRQNWLAGE
jgi:VCBS repeat-containing protein